MRYHTKEYYRLLMSLDAAACYEPVVDKESYSEEDIEELYQQAMDKYIEEERSFYDAPPEYMIDDEDLENFDPEDFTFIAPGLFDDADDGDWTPRHPADREELLRLREEMFALAVEEYENRPPFDEEEAKADFEEMYRDSLEEPDEDLPEWVREAVDPRILAMDLMPEKIYMKLAAEDADNEERFDALDEAADEALETLRESLPEDYQEFADILEDLEDSPVAAFGMEKGFFGGDDGEDSWLEILMVGWNDEGKEVPRLLKFIEPEILEDEGIEVTAWEEDGDTRSDCDYLYGELYLEDGRPEIHMMFSNNGLKYLTLRCSEAVAEHGWNNEVAAIGR